MDRYHFETFPDQHWPVDLLEDARNLIEEATDGILTEARFFELAHLERSVYGNIHKGFMQPGFNFERAMILEGMRSRFRLHVSFAVFTTEYMDSLARLLAGLRVHEVCARNGVLARHMVARGVEWSCSDLEPQADHVEALDGMEALERHKPDVVFASWIDYGFDLDQRLATKVPCVFIQEGCTGTVNEGFYDSDDYECIDTPSWFVDVPQWQHLHDSTCITIPRGGSNPFHFA